MNCNICKRTETISNPIIDTCEDCNFHGCKECVYALDYNYLQFVTVHKTKFKCIFCVAYQQRIMKELLSEFKFKYVRNQIYYII